MQRSEPASGLSASSIIASTDRRLVRLGIYRSSSRPVVKLQSLLAVVAIATAVLLLLVGLVTRWQNGEGSDSAGVDVLWWVVWIPYTLAKVVLVVLVVATIYQWFHSRGRSSPRS